MSDDDEKKLLLMTIHSKNSFMFVCPSPHSPNGDQPVQHVETVPVWHGLDHLARGGSLHLEEALGGEAKDGAGEFVSIGATFVLKLFDGLDISNIRY